MHPQIEDSHPDLTALRIQQRPYDHPDAAELVAALFAEQGATYGYADPPDADPAEYLPPSGLFLVAYDRAGTALACGGYRRANRSSRTVEVKKMYVRPNRRSYGIGRQILQHLEQQATDHGAHQIILETGVHNAAALALYASSGYKPIRPYVSGRDEALNRAFAKQLDKPTQAAQ